MTTTRIYAKIGAVASGIGLVALSLASALPANAQTVTTTTSSTASTSSVTAAQIEAEIAALQTQLATLTGTSATATVFTRDLTIGDTGSDVIALQNWLITKGYSIPAGATGYFGTETQAAVAAYQAANGISPAVGYFGPITRANVNAILAVNVGTTSGSLPAGCSSTSGFSPTTGVSCSTGVTTTTGSGTSTTLSGGEANLTDYILRSEGGTLAEGGQDVKLATASFDVVGGDINVQRAELDLQARNTSMETHPWDYIQSVSVWAGDTKLATVDASNMSDWSDNLSGSDHDASSADFYTIQIPNINYVARDGSTVDLTFTADAEPTIDSANLGQTFLIDVPDQGIRAIDAAGLQEYVGGTSDTVSFGFSSAINGTLTFTEDSSSPLSGVLVANTSSVSNQFPVLVFDVHNNATSDAEINDLTFNVATSSASGSPAANITNIIQQARLTIAGQTYIGDVNSNNTVTFRQMNTVIPANSEQTGTLSVTLFAQNDNYAATGEGLTFSLPSSDVTAEGAQSGDTITSSDLSGTATGNLQNISTGAGINVAGNSSNSQLTYNSNTPSSSFGTFTLSFNVTAAGNDVYIPKTIAAATASSTYAGVVFDPNMLSSTSGGTVTAALTSTAQSDNSNFYVVHSGETQTFTVTVTIDPTATGTYEVGITQVKFSTTDTNLNSLQTLNVDDSQPNLHTNPLPIPNS